MNSATAAVADAPLPKPEGLEGVVAASTALSHVFGEEGRLVYRGYDIHELAGKASFEEVAYLLWRGHLPNRVELSELQSKLEENRSLPPVVIDVLRALPDGTEPLDALRSGLSVLGPALGDLFSVEEEQNLADEGVMLTGASLRETILVPLLRPE